MEKEREKGQPFELRLEGTYKEVIRVFEKSTLPLGVVALLLEKLLQEVEAQRRAAINHLLAERAQEGAGDGNNGAGTG